MPLDKNKTGSIDSSKIISSAAQSRGDAKMPPKYGGHFATSPSPKTKTPIVTGPQDAPVPTSVPPPRIGLPDDTSAELAQMRLSTGSPQVAHALAREHGIGNQASVIVANMSGNRTDMDRMLLGQAGGYTAQRLAEAGSQAPPLLPVTTPDLIAPTPDQTDQFALTAAKNKLRSQHAADNVSDEDLPSFIEERKNIMPERLDPDGNIIDSFACIAGTVEQPDGSRLVSIEGDIGTIKTFIESGEFSPENTMFTVDSSSEEFNKMVGNTEKYGDWTLSRSDTTEKKREREVAKIQKRLGDELTLASKFWPAGSGSKDEFTMMWRYGVGAATPERKKQMYESIDAAEKEFALTQSQYEMLKDRNKMSYKELARKTGMSDVAAHSLKQEIGDLIEKFEPLVSEKSKDEFYEELSRVKQIMSKSEGPYSQARADFKTIIKDSKSSPAERAVAAQALKRLDNPKLEVDDEIVTAYNKAGEFASSLSDREESFDLYNTGVIKGGLKKLSDSLATNEDKAAAGQQIQMAAMARTIKDTGLLNQLSEFTRNASHNTEISKDLDVFYTSLASGDFEKAEHVMNSLVSKDILVDRGTGKTEALKMSDAQKRQLYLTLCSPEAENLINAWSFVSDNPFDINGNYSFDEDWAFQTIKGMVAKGRLSEARELVLNGETLARENDAVGMYGKPVKYWVDMRAELGL